MEPAAADADADRALLIDGDLTDHRELLIAPPARADVARIDPVFVERLGAPRELRQQQMSVVVKVADERSGDVRVEHALFDFGNGGRGFGRVDGDANHVGPGVGQLDTLLSRCLRIGGVSQRHRLHDDWRTAADLDATHHHTNRAVQLQSRHESLMIAFASMRAIVVREFGNPDVMRLEDITTLTPSPTQALVRVRAAGVNPVDTYIRSGNYALKPPLPYTPGNDGAGEVEAVGPDVKGFKPGDRVYIANDNTGLPRTGIYADHALCQATQLHRLPANVSFAQGAAIGVPYGTAVYALFKRASARPGETVFIHGASGGVGIAAVQICRAHGMTVIGTAGTERGLRAVKEDRKGRRLNP